MILPMFSDANIQIHKRPTVFRSLFLLPGLLLLLASAATTFGQSANIIKYDTGNRGNWQGVYGKEGSLILPGYYNLPSYATVTPVNNASWTWANDTSDKRALLKPGSTTNRVAACW